MWRAVVLHIHITCAYVCILSREAPCTIRRCKSYSALRCLIVRDRHTSGKEQKTTYRGVFVFCVPCNSRTQGILQERYSTCCIHPGVDSTDDVAFSFFFLSITVIVPFLKYSNKYHLHTHQTITHNRTVHCV